MVLLGAFHHGVAGSIPCDAIFYINNLKKKFKTATRQELNRGHLHYT